MSDSKSSLKSRRPPTLDSDMAAAAQQLIQLSDEDTNSNCCRTSDGGQKIETKMIKNQSQDEITSAKIEEIFGKEGEIPRKKQRYRTIESIYKDTKRIKVSNDKNSWY
ncbi:hypothetical protein HRI_000388200 [Hibiscus trionum]|uniref:Uncharacterized protein n=1 Tax=Hibiscus trionum TaxID=183268 RepID=A0A9W7LK42_HIBTR|nr:hypothetical protein HRI_000388200 [Hibiscus trionum]